MCVCVCVKTVCAEPWRGVRATCQPGVSSTPCPIRQVFSLMLMRLGWAVVKTFSEQKGVYRCGEQFWRKIVDHSQTNTPLPSVLFQKFTFKFMEVHCQGNDTNNWTCGPKEKYGGIQSICCPRANSWQGWWSWSTRSSLMQRGNGCLFLKAEAKQT